MRRATLATAILLPLGVLLAQVPQSGTAAPPGGAPDGVFTPAPIPGVIAAPSVTGPKGGPGGIPDQIAPSGLSAGPANSTPFSATGSGQLPTDPSGSAGRDSQGGTAASTPNLSP